MLVRNLRGCGQTCLSESDAMTFTPICPASAVSEGGMGLFHAGKRACSWFGRWAARSRPIAGVVRMPLTEAAFNGKAVTCPHHQWGFDAGNGKCVTHVVRNALHPYELRVEGGEILVDVGPARAGRAVG